MTRTDRVDFGWFDESSKAFEYLYRFATYEIRVGDRVLSARRYADEWWKVSIFPDGGPLAAVPYDDRAFSLVVRYFLGLADVRTVAVFVQEGYVDVDPAQLAGQET